MIGLQIVEIRTVKNMGLTIVLLPEIHISQSGLQ